RRTCDPAWHAAYTKALAQRMEELRPNGGRVFLTLIPYPVGSWVLANPHNLVDCFNRAVREVAEGAPFVTLLDLQGELCPRGQCVMESNGKPVRPDGLHFDGPGAEEIARWVLTHLL